MCMCFWQGYADEIEIWKKFMIAGDGVRRTFYKILINIFFWISNFFQFFCKFYKNQKYVEMIANCVKTPTPIRLQRLSSTLGIIKTDLRESMKEDLTEAI